MNYLPIIKDYGDRLTSAQVFATFKKEIIAFFIRDIPGVEIICDLDIKIFETDYNEPSGFSKRKIGEFESNSPTTRSLPYKIFQKYSNPNNPAIFKVRISALKHISEDELIQFFDKYRCCEDKFFSYALNRRFEIGDGDDSGAVSIGKNSKGFYVDIWVRSFIH